VSIDEFPLSSLLLPGQIYHGCLAVIMTYSALIFNLNCSIGGSGSYHGKNQIFFYKISFFLHPMPLLTYFIKHIISKGNDVSFPFLIFACNSGFNRRCIMKVNEGMFDRLLRVIMAVAIIILFLAGKLPGNWALLLIFSGTFLMSATTGHCPLYNPLGINTCKKQMRD
jgi:hypothetical protein